MSQGTDFAYAIGRIRSIEKRLIDRARYDRIIDAPSIADALRLINESGYNFSEEKSQDAFYFDEVLKDEQNKVFSLFEDMLKGDDTFKVFKLKGDYHNVKVVLKSFLTGQKPDETILVEGTGNWKEYEEYLLKGETDKVPQHIGYAYKQALDAYEKSGDARQIDLVCDSCYYKLAIDLALTGSHRAIAIFLKTKTDLVNIKTFLRIKALDLGADLLDRSLLPGGFIDPSVFTEAFEEDLDFFKGALKNTEYTDLVEDCVEDYTKRGNFTSSEKFMDDFLLGLVKKSKHVPLGPEPLLGFLVGKEMEIMNLRIILTGKINNIKGNIIRERLRQSYA